VGLLGAILGGVLLHATPALLIDSLHAGCLLGSSASFLGAGLRGLFLGVPVWTIFWLGPPKTRRQRFGSHFGLPGGDALSCHLFSGF
jgi:hypothetical protein